MDRFRLECFVAVAEELHFRRAAERCHITQPGMSQQVRRLEDELGVQLANRTRRSVSLTRAGEAFLVEARRTLRQMDVAVDAAVRTDRGEVGRLDVGVTEPALYIVFPEVAARFRAALPRVGLAVHELTTAEQEAALRAGDLQLGLVHPPLDDPALRCETIAEPAFDVALPAGHRLAAHDELRLGDLAGEPFVLFPRGIAPRLHDTILASCRAAGFSPVIAVESHPAQSIIAHVAAGAGIGLIAADVQRLARPGVTYRPLRGRRPTLALGVAHHHDDRSPAVARFVEAALAAGAAL